MSNAKKSKKSPKAKKVPAIVLAEGEQTGHSHVLAGDNVTLLDDKDGEKTFRIAGKKGAKVDHQEHKQIAVPPGEYTSKQVLEYNHFAEEARVVRD